MNEYENFLIDALDMVSTWDLAEEDLADAVLAQARLMAGVLPEEYVVQRDIHNLPN
jgi:fructose-1,6-bisphosphatase/inositol monophosphatase family enzyme